MKEKIIFFGASNLGVLAHKLLNQEYDICFYCDNDSRKIGGKFNGISVIGINELKELYKDYTIIITSMYIKEIQEQLEENNIINYKIFALAKDTYNLRQRQKIDDNIYCMKYFGEDIKFYLPDINEYIQSLIYTKCMFYEIETLEKLKEFHLDNKVIIDVGANIGNHSLYFARIINSLKVYSFDPNKKLAEIFNKNMKINNVENKVELRNIGISSEKGYGNLEIIEEDNWGANKVSISEKGEFEIGILDELFETFESEIGLIKIDVEGMELEVIKGAKNIIEKFKPILCIEILDEEHYKQINNILAKFNYKEVNCDNCGTYIFSAKK